MVRPRICPCIHISHKKVENYNLTLRILNTTSYKIVEQGKIVTQLAKRQVSRRPKRTDVHTDRRTDNSSTEDALRMVAYFVYIYAMHIRYITHKDT